MAWAIGSFSTWKRNSPRRAKPWKIGRRGRAPALQSSSNDACSSDCPLIRPSVRTGAPFPIPSVAARHLPLTRGVGPQGTAYREGEDLAVTLIRHGFAVPPSPWKGEGLRAAARAAPTAEMHRKCWFGRARRCCGTATAAIFANPGPSGPGGIADSHSIFARRKFSA